MRRIISLLMLASLLSACSLTPDYERPILDVPEKYEANVPPGESIANLDWWKLFEDKQLQLLFSFLH